MLKKYSLLLGVFYTVALTLFSLIKLNIKTPSLPLYKDKIAHLLAHFIFVLLWFVVFKYRLNIKYNKSLIFVAVFSIVYGLFIELIQGFTVNRQSDVNDVIANTIGMIIAISLLLSIKKRLLKNNNTLLF